MHQNYQKYTILTRNTFLVGTWDQNNCLLGINLDIWLSIGRAAETLPAASWRSVKSGVPKIHKVYLHGFNTSKVYAWMNNCMDFTNLMYSNYSRLENNVQWINQCQSFMYNWSWSGFWNIIFTYPIFQGLTSAKSTTSLVIYFRRNKVYASWKLYKTSISVNRGSHFQVRFVWQVWDGQLSPSFKYIRF